jgi:hypothetical protein
MAGILDDLVNMGKVEEKEVKNAENLQSTEKKDDNTGKRAYTFGEEFNKAFKVEE